MISRVIDSLNYKINELPTRRVVIAYMSTNPEKNGNLYKMSLIYLENENIRDISMLSRYLPHLSRERVRALMAKVRRIGRNHL